MKTETIEIRTSDGTASAYEVTPGGSAKRGAILFFMDGVGLRDALRRMADRLGAAGYHVLLPDLYYRVGRELHWDPREVFGKPEKLAEMRKTIGQLTPEMVMRDVDAFLGHLGSRADVDLSRLGVVGYCMGGRFALLTASHFPDRVRASASIHPGGLVTPEPTSPHLRLAQVKARVYVGRASDDASFTEEQAQTFDDALRSAGVRYQLERYAAKHGWAVDDTPVHDVAEAERHYRAILALFRAELGPDADA
jgi:carboxymethylenebutenolidase